MFAHVQEDLNGRVDALLDGGDCAVGVESTVITLAEGTPRVLRPGGVTVSQLRSILGEVEVDDAVVHRLQEGKSAASPGMKYKHYSPKADVVIVDASPEEYVTFVNSKQNCHALCFDEDTEKLKVPFVSYGTRYDGEKQAHLLFSALQGNKECYVKAGETVVLQSQQLLLSSTIMFVTPSKSDIAKQAIAVLPADTSQPDLLLHIVSQSPFGQENSLRNSGAQRQYFYD